MGTPNTYGVNQKLWNSFKTNDSKKLFNDMMEQSVNNQEITCHPKMPTMADDQWYTICHNMACYAAWALRDEKLSAGETVADINISTGEEVGYHTVK